MIDKEMINDFTAISAMIVRAQKEDLLTEVIWSFANEIRSGVVDYRQAAANACYEWDL